MKEGCGSLQESRCSFGAPSPKGSLGKPEWSLACQLKVCPLSEGERHGKKAKKTQLSAEACDQSP